jgi:Na+-driven multidrug efflux pump
LPGTMASATQRFFAHALGEEDQGKLNRIFGVNILIYILFGIVALIILLSAGLWFVDNHLSMPEERVDAVKTVFYVAVITFSVSILKSPFMAMIIAHEDMIIYAYMAILDAFMKLGVVFLLVYLPGEKIVVYSWLLLILAIIDMIIFQAICFRKYDECKLRNIQWDRQLAREVTGFTGWTLFGALTSVARGAAVTVLLNQYFSPAVVAARAIALNISNKSNMLSGQFNTSLYPPIIKAYSAGRRDEMYSLVFNGSKATFFLMWILVLPLFIEMDAILTLWLKNLPEHAVIFAKLTLVEALILSISLPVATAARAPGRMALYESTLGALQLSILFGSWMLLEAGFGPEFVFYVAILVNLIMFLVRLILVSHLTGLPFAAYITRVLFPVLGVVAVSTALTVALARALPPGALYLLITLICSFVICLITIYTIGLSSSMRQAFLAYVNSKFSKIGSFL